MCNGWLLCELFEQGRCSSFCQNVWSERPLWPIPWLLLLYEQYFVPWGTAKRNTVFSLSTIMLWPSISGLKLHLGKEKRLCSQSPTGAFPSTCPPNPALFQPYLRHIIKASSTSSFLQLPWSYLLSAHSVFPLPRWLPLTAPKCASILNVISHHRVWNHSPTDSFFQILEFYNPCSIPLDSECLLIKTGIPNFFFRAVSTSAPSLEVHLHHGHSDFSLNMQERRWHCSEFILTDHWRHMHNHMPSDLCWRKASFKSICEVAVRLSG